MRSGMMRAHLASEDPIELDKHRGMAAQKGTDIRRVVTEIEANAKLLRHRQGAVEMQILAVPTTSWCTRRLQRRVKS
jgi:hypothetical protein